MSGTERGQKSLRQIWSTEKGVNMDQPNVDQQGLGSPILQSSGAPGKEFTPLTKASQAPAHSSNEWLAKTMKQLTSSKTINDLKTVLCDVLAQVSQMDSEMKLLKAENSHLKKEVDDLKADMAANAQLTDQTIADLSHEIQSTAPVKDFAALVSKVEDLEGRSRRNNLRIFGVPEGEEKKRRINGMLC